MWQVQEQLCNITVVNVTFDNKHDAKMICDMFNRKHNTNRFKIIQL